MSPPEAISLVLGVVSFVLGMIALGLAVRNDRVVKALSNLEFDEKRAVISEYCRRVEDSRGDVEYLRPMEANVSALAHLASYLDEEKRERLIREDLLPALQHLSDQKPTPRPVVVKTMVEEALKFGVCEEALKQLKSDLAKS